MTTLESRRCSTAVSVSGSSPGHCPDWSCYLTCHALCGRYYSTSLNRHCHFGFTCKRRSCIHHCFATYILSCRHLSLRTVCGARLCSPQLCRTFVVPALRCWKGLTSVREQGLVPGRCTDRARGICVWTSHLYAQQWVDEWATFCLRPCGSFFSLSMAAL